MDYTQQPPTVLSLCPGILGLERALERVLRRLNVLAYVEIEAFVIENLVCAMEAGALAPALIWPDVKTLPSHIFRNRVDWLLGGYPCTPFSLAGQRLGEDDPRHLWPHIERIIETVRPLCCLFENVDDHLTLGFPQVYDSLQRMGYNVEVGVHSTEEVGGVHERQRLFILAIHNSCIDRLRQEYSVYARGHCFESSIEMAYSTSDGLTRRIRDLQKENAGVRQSEERRQEERRESYYASELDDTTTERLERGKWISRPGELTRSSEEVANTNEQQRGSKQRDGSSNEERSRNESRRGNEMADTESNSEQRCESTDTSNELATIERSGQLANFDFCREQPGFIARVGRFGEQTSKWPARPGQQQYGWEHPRTLTREAESEVGLSVDGYNFREDFLRALGNSVVPDCAERAIIDLFKKHGIC